VLLGQVLEVSLGERDLGSKDELVAWMLAVVHHGVMDCRVGIEIPALIQVSEIPSSLTGDTSTVQLTA
jgi:hypothetical protein